MRELFVTSDGVVGVPKKENKFKQKDLKIKYSNFQ